MNKQGFYFIEPFTEDFYRFFKLEGVHYEGRTKYQQVHCFKSRLFGKVLFLDNKIQSAQVDEFVYHEALVHPAMITHPSPRRVLVLGGGEGAVLREILKHSPVKRAVMVDIDKELVGLCRKILPEWSRGAFTDPKVKLVFQDARRFVERSKTPYDIILSDLTEPLDGGPSLRLFTREFFEIVSGTLGDDGLFVLHAGSTDPHYNHFFSSCVKTLMEVFPVVRPYWTSMFSFSLPWGFVIASKNIDPSALDEKEVRRRLAARGVKRLGHYSPQIHRAAFALPPYLKKAIRAGRLITDAKPFVWKA